MPIAFDREKNGGGYERTYNEPGLSNARKDHGNHLRYLKRSPEKRMRGTSSLGRHKKIKTIGREGGDEKFSEPLGRKTDQNWYNSKRAKR